METEAEAPTEEPKAALLADDEEVSTEVEEMTAASTVSPLPKEHIIDLLFDFLRQEEELNPLLCGYFCKMLVGMMSSNKKPFCLYVFNPRNEVISSMIKHVYNRSVADTLVKILSIDINVCEYEEELPNFMLSDKEQLIKIVTDLVAQIELQEYEGKLNAAMVLQELYNSSRHLAAATKDAKFHKLLFAHLSKDDLTVRSSLSVLLSFFEKLPEVYDNEGGESNKLDYEVKEDFDTNMGEYASSLCDIIEADSDIEIYQQYDTTLVRPFGFTRVQAMKIFLAIVKEGNISWTAHFGSLFSKLLTFTQDYPWNSALHKIIEEIFVSIIRSNSEYDLGS